MTTLDTQPIWVPEEFVRLSMRTGNKCVLLQIPKILPEIKQNINIENLGSRNNESRNITIGGLYGQLNWSDIVDLAMDLRYNIMEKEKNVTIYTVKVFLDKDIGVHSNRTEWYNEKKQLHREDGPAVEWVLGSFEYWLSGVKYNNKNLYDVALENLKLNKENSLDGKLATIDGKEYKLTLIDNKK